MERTINDIVREHEEQGTESQWVPEQEEEEVEWVCVGETETVWGTNFEEE